jgi:hypothetical protein
VAVIVGATSSGGCGEQGQSLQFPFVDVSIIFTLLGIVCDIVHSVLIISLTYCT